MGAKVKKLHICKDVQLELKWVNYVKVNQAAKVCLIWVKKCYTLLRIVNKYVTLFTYLFGEQT